MFMQFLTIQDTRPTTSDWPAAPDAGTNIYAKVAIRCLLISHNHTALACC